ncbi:MAG: mechanosensitive ion channel [Balneolaceae bacterium]
MKKLFPIFFLLIMISVILLGSSFSLMAQDSLSTSSVDSTTSLTINTKVSEFKDFFSITKIISSLIVLFGTYFFTRILSFLLGALAEKRSSYRLILKRVVPFLNVSIWSIALFVVIAGIISPPFETILTVGASVGIAVGFAAQDILKNIFGGFIIIMDRPFQVGDKIEVDGFYGEVTEIGLRSTRIVTPDDSLVSLPNADLVSNAVSNSNSGALDCQVVASIFLPASVNVEKVKEIAYRAAVTSRYVYLKKPIVVMSENKVFEQNYVVQFKVKAYVLDIRYEFLLKSDITELILGELNRKGLVPKSGSINQSVN